MSSDRRVIALALAVVSTGAGGRFLGEDFATFWEHRCPKKPKKVVVWRAPHYTSCTP